MFGEGYPFDDFYINEHVFKLDFDETDDPSSIFYRQIVYAKIRKILYSPKDQTIIYVAMGVYDGGGIGTNYFNVFLNVFKLILSSMNKQPHQERV